MRPAKRSQEEQRTPFATTTQQTRSEPAARKRGGSALQDRARKADGEGAVAHVRYVRRVVHAVLESARGAARTPVDARPVLRFAKKNEGKYQEGFSDPGDQSAAL